MKWFKTSFGKSIKGLNLILLKRKGKICLNVGT